MSFSVHLRPRRGSELVRPLFFASSDSDPKLEWHECAKEIVRRGLLQEPKEGYNVVLALVKPLVEVCRDHDLLGAIRRAIERTWGATVLVAVGELKTSEPEDDAVALGEWISKAQKQGAHGVVGLPGDPSSAGGFDTLALERGVDRAHRRHQILLDLLARGGAWCARIAGLNGRMGKLYQSLEVGSLPSTYARNDLLAVVEDDSRLVCELGPNLPVPCASEVEVFDFVSRLLRPVNPPVSMPTSPSSLLLTGGFQPDQLGYELHCVHAAKEVGLVGALLPPACRVVCPALTQGRLHHVMESHASIRVWVHTGHGNIENLVCADGLDLTRQQLTAARRKAPRLELVVLSACNSDKLGAALARAHVRFVVAYPRAVLPALAYHVSHPVVRAYFENLEKDGLEEAVCRAFFAGTDAQRGAGADHRPVLFVDGTRRPRAR